MVKLDDLTNIEVDKKPPAPVRNAGKASASQWKVSCEHFRYKRLVAILVGVIFLVVVVTVPTVLVRKSKTKTSTTTTTTVADSSTVPLENMLTNRTKWKQEGITVFDQVDFDESMPNDNPMYMEDDDTIYLAEVSKNRVIEIKLSKGNFSVVVDGNPDENGIENFWLPSDIVVDKQTDSIMICSQGNRQIVRWPRQNATSSNIIISNIPCNGLAMDDRGYLYASDWLSKEVRKWKIGIYDEGTVVAGGNGEGNGLGQLLQPMFLSVDKDGSVYVVDKSNHRVMKWMKNATKGVVVAGGNSEGNSLRQLRSPSGVVIDHLHNVYITDTNNHRVMGWIKGASEGSVIAGGNEKGNETNQLHSPSDLLFDQRGNLYVFDSLNHRIQKFCIESY